MYKPQIGVRSFLLMMVSLIFWVSGCQGSVEMLDPDQEPHRKIQSTREALETEKAALSTSAARFPSVNATQGSISGRETPIVMSTPTPDEIGDERYQDSFKPLLLTPEEVPYGMVFRNLYGIFWINHEGSVEKLSYYDSSMAEFLITPDGTRLVYQKENDLWLMYLTTGDLKKLSETPNHKELLLSGIPGDSRRVLIATQYEDDCNRLELMRIEGGWRVPLMDNLDILSPLVPSPDGQTLAFRAQECDAEIMDPTAWIYQLGERAELFDLEKYGISVERYLVPSWSPDGKWLAWGVILSTEPIPEEEYAGAQERPPDPAQLGIVLFNRVTKEAKLLDSFEGDTYCEIGKIAWSPDSQWLAYSRSDMFWEANGLRVLDVDGQEVYNFPDRFVDPVWSPDGRWLAFGAEGVMLVEVGKWVPFQIGPNSTLPIDWLNIGP